MGYFEEYDTSKLSNGSGSTIVPQMYIADSGKYEDRRVGTIGKDICVFMESRSLAPAQDAGTGDLNLGATTTPYVIYCNNSTIKSGANDVLAGAFVEDSVAYEAPKTLSKKFLTMVKDINIGGND